MTARTLELTQTPRSTLEVNVNVLVAQLYPTLCNPLPSSSVRGILQARILEWVAIPFSRGSSQPRDKTQVFHIADRYFTVRATWEALEGATRKYFQTQNLNHCQDPYLYLLIFWVFLFPKYVTP